MRPSFALALALALLLALALATMTKAHAGEPPPSLTLQQLALVDRLIATSAADDPNRPALFFKRGALCMEQARAYAAQPARQKEWHLAAVKALLSVTESPRFASYSRADEVLFYLAYELGQAGREPEAQPYYQRLLDDHPKSKLRPDAYAALGDAAVARHELDAAATLYAAAVAGGESRVRDYARHRLAWCALSRDANLAAAAQFSSLAKRDNVKLRGDVKKDLVRALARSRIEPAQARAYLATVDAEHTDELLDLLAAEYRDAGKGEQCRALARGAACD
jgi:hypothetical protein